MYEVSSRTYPLDEIDKPSSDRPLMVISCGHSVFINPEFKAAKRPNGRRDYQLLYLRSGKATYTIHGKDHLLTPGHIVFYHPSEPQFYSYDSRDTPDVYWIHFTGGNVPKELENLGLFSARIFYPKCNLIFDQLFDQIILELQLKKQYYYSIADSRFRELLCLMAREISTLNEVTAPHTREIEQAVNIFHTRFNQPFNITDYAASCHMNVCWFTRLFKRQLGVSPQQYLTNIRISRACELLAQGFRVAETSEIVGYQDPLYFSRIFKKHTGQSPSQYRKSSIS
ncbi:MAG: AraC family transcriptional regulator [Hungatella sp.]|jgi:AraC-like DNA-binding protein|nr:AraC family transcriptional regulator [Hungatella sp.]